MNKDIMKDLLERFSEKNHPINPIVESTNKPSNTEEIELNLGLSLGGCFGAKPKENHSLYRSSSSSTCFQTAFLKGESDVPLVRTSSLPLENSEETRKRKGLQSLKQMEAMKRRAEKQKMFRSKNEALISFRQPNTSFTAQGVGLGSGSGSGFGLRGPLLPASQGSIGSQGSGSEIENQPTQGANNLSGSRSPASVLCLPERRGQRPIVAPCSELIKKLDITSETEMKVPMEKAKVTVSRGNESETKALEDMPCVFTKGVGPDGKRTEGLLFKYKKGEEVMIVCVCHGSFFSPAEFVKHAGGVDVANPLQHIVVAPSPSILS